MSASKILKKVIGLTLVLSAVSALSALEVNRSELQTVGTTDTIVFRNYNGPHAVINSIQQIREIGSSLGKTVNKNVAKSTSVGSNDRYAVIHAVDPSAKEKFDADIFIVGKNASVDHIINLRRIISAYLSSAYGYSTKDADTIATFVTVYNAVYRGNIDYFKSRYKDIVTKNLSPSIAGLSTDYQDWPGNTQIVIPLYDLNGGLSTVDTSVISDKNVVKSMQGEDDKGIDARKNMVDIKERESDAVQEKADQAKAKADAEKEKLAAEQKKSAEANKAKADAKKDADKAKADSAKAKADADKAKADADKAKKEADASKKSATQAQKQADQAKKDAKAKPNDAQAQKKAEDAQKKADEAKKKSVEDQKKSDEAKQDAAQKQAKADDSQKQADQAQKQADQAEKTADEQNKKTEEQAQNAEQAQNDADKVQEQADQKRDEAQEERAEIAKDQDSLIKEGKNPDSEFVTYGLKNVDDEGLMNEIIKMDYTKGTVIKASPCSEIRQKGVFDEGDYFVALAGKNSGNGAVKLVTIDKKTLEILDESTERLSEYSSLAPYDGNYYCTIQEGSDCYIGKFNNKLQLQLKSKTKVKGATPITSTSEGIMVTDSTGKAVLLNLRDLSVKSGS